MNIRYRLTTLPLKVQTLKYTNILSGHHLQEHFLNAAITDVSPRLLSFLAYVLDGQRTAAGHAKMLMFAFACAKSAARKIPVLDEIRAENAYLVKFNDLVVAEMSNGEVFAKVRWTSIFCSVHWVFYGCKPFSGDRGKYAFQLSASFHAFVEGN